MTEFAFMRRLKSVLKAFRFARLSETPNLTVYVCLSYLALLLHVKSKVKRRLSINGYNLFLGISGSSGFGFFIEVVVDDIYRPYSSTLKATECPIVIDCGANSGYFSLWAIKQNPRAKVYAFEPHPLTYNQLCESIDANGAKEAIVPINSAVGDFTGELQFLVREDTNMAIVAKTIDRFLDPLDTFIRVPVTSLDAFCEAHNMKPSHLKIDVEGFEVEVLNGAKNAIATAASVVVEAHSTELLAKCTSLLSDLGFNVLAEKALLFAERKAACAEISPY